MLPACHEAFELCEQLFSGGLHRPSAHRPSSHSAASAERNVHLQGLLARVPQDRLDLRAVVVRAGIGARRHGPECVELAR